MNEKIKLVCVDLDGTLLKNDKTISEKTISAAKQAAERGIEIVPVTGRPLSGLPQAVKRLPGVHCAVTSNGACITELCSGKKIYSAPLPNIKSVEIMHFLNEKGCLYEAFGDDVGYIRVPLRKIQAKIHRHTHWGLYFPILAGLCLIYALFLNPKKKCANEIFINLPCEKERKFLASYLFFGFFA